MLLLMRVGRRLLSVLADHRDGRTSGRNASEQPIKFDGLIGDAVIRDANGSPSAYNGIPIQASSATATGALNGDGLLFDGGTGHYAAVTGVVKSSLRFDAAGGRKGTSVTTRLTLLSLDVLANKPNYPIFVDLDFSNANSIALSTSVDFTCWIDVALSNANGSTPFIDSGLTAAAMGTLKGLVVSDPAAKVAVGGITDTAGPVTLLGIVTTSVSGKTTYAYSYSLYNDATLVPTAFVP